MEKKEKKYRAWSCRNFEQVPNTPNPYPLKHYDVQATEKNGKKFVETPAVAPSRASDFSIVNNARYRHGGSSPVRISCDPVDLEKKLENML